MQVFLEAGTHFRPFPDAPSALPGCKPGAANKERRHLPSL